MYLLITTAKLIMCEELHTLKHYLRKCLRTNTYYMCHVEDYEPNNKLATLARDWLMKRVYDSSAVYNVWFAMRELIIKEFTADPMYHDVIKTVLHNRSEYAKTDPDEEFDWNYDNDNYATIKKSILYHLEDIDGYINETCQIARELRKMYIDRDLHIDFSDINARNEQKSTCKSLYVNSVLFCKRSRDVYDKNCLKINLRDEYVEAYNALCKWCEDGSFHFDEDMKVTLTTITLIDIIGVVVDEVCENHTNEHEYANAVYMTWYAAKLWMMLDNGKNYHTFEEICHIFAVNNHDVNISHLLNNSKYYKNSPKNLDTVTKCIQHCEKLFDKYISKFYGSIARANVDDLSFNLPSIDFSLTSYNVKYYYRDIAVYKNVLKKYIDIISASDGIVNIPKEEYNAFCKGVQTLKEMKENLRVYKKHYVNDEDRYECDYDDTDSCYSESDYEGSD